MVDGTGMCGGCRVTVGGQTRFVCVDGPEFDGHKVDFDIMMRRLGAYRPIENRAHEACHLELAARRQAATRA
jgi:ferredoxin--NADP+ reductase